MKKHLLLLLGLMVALVTLSGCSQNADRITVVGSSALQLLADQAGNEYRLSHAGVNIVVQGGGSGTGLSQVQAGAVQIGDSDVFAEDQAGIDATKLVDHRVAIVGIVPVVNKDVGIKNLSMQQLRQIFAGKIKNWKQVGGKNLAVLLINRAKGSGTRSTFEKIVMQGTASAQAQEQDSNGTVKKIVSSTPGAISYLSFSYASDPNIQKLSIDNVEPTAKNVEDNSWKLWAYEHMYTKGKPNKKVQGFIDYIMSDKVQRELVPKLGYIPIKSMKVERDANYQIKRID
ncbi:MAG: phosphate ABC transporter substrate-binding protein PstS family protein [Lactobacillus sp.]|nr:phosphate ABC transporter substrate-binding protein PstS family protein [Lactobacillus sp.]